MSAEPSPTPSEDPAFASLWAWLTGHRRVYLVRDGDTDYDHDPPGDTPASDSATMVSENDFPADDTEDRPEDRRRHRRYAIHSSVLLAVGQPPVRRMRARVTDISRCGAQLQLPEFLPPGIGFSIVAVGNEPERETDACPQGRVVWSRISADFSVFEAGGVLHFETLPPGNMPPPL